MKITVTRDQVLAARSIVRRAQANGDTPRRETVLIANAPTEGGTINV